MDKTDSNPSAPPLPLSIISEEKSGIGRSKRRVEEKVVEASAPPLPAYDYSPISAAAPVTAIPVDEHDTIILSTGAVVSLLHRSGSSPSTRNNNNDLLEEGGFEAGSDEEDNDDTDHHNNKQGVVNNWFARLRWFSFVLGILCLVEGIQAAVLNNYSSDAASGGTSFVGFAGFLLCLYFTLGRYITHAGYRMFLGLNVIFGIIAIACGSSSYGRLKSLKACMSGDNSYFHPYQFYGDTNYYENTMTCSRQDMFAWNDCNCVTSELNCLINSGRIGTACEQMLLMSPSLAHEVYSYAIVHIVLAIVIGLLFLKYVKEEDVEDSWAVWNGGKRRYRPPNAVHSYFFLPLPNSGYNNGYGTPGYDNNGAQSPMHGGAGLHRHHHHASGAGFIPAHHHGGGVGLHHLPNLGGAEHHVINAGVHGLMHGVAAVGHVLSHIH